MRTWRAKPAGKFPGIDAPNIKAQAAADHCFDGMDNIRPRLDLINNNQ
jgi:hypothetical protein